MRPDFKVGPAFQSWFWLKTISKFFRKIQVKLLYRQVKSQILSVRFLMIRSELSKLFLIFDRENLSEVSFRNILALVRSGFCWDKRKITEKRHHNNGVSRRNSFELKTVLLDSLLSDLSHSVVTSNDSINFN